MDSDEEFTPPPSKRRARSVSHDNDKNDPSYRGNIDRASSPSDRGGVVKSDYFPASRLFEYQWPLGDTSAEYFMLQEQVKEFLDIRGIQRKYPDWRRRTLDIDERKYLVGMGVVTETQANMGLVALHSEEVLEVMASDYKQRYSEYVEVIREREFQQTLRNKMIEARRLAAASDLMSTKEDDHSDMRTKAMKMVAQFNTQLAKQRMALTEGCVDTQTKLQLVPRNPQEVLPVPTKSRYPAALLPGQYCDSYPKYTSNELKQLPLNTVAGLPDYLVRPEQTLDQNETSKIQEKSLLENKNQSSSSLSKASPTTLQKNVAEDLLRLLNTGNKSISTDTPKQTLVSGSKQVTLLNTLQKLLASYSSGQSSVDSKEKESVDVSSKQGSTASTRRSSLTDLLMRDGSSGKGTSNQQVSEAVKEISEDVDSDLKTVSKEEGGAPSISDPSPARAKRANTRAALCSVCRKGRSSNSRGVAEDFVECTQCGNTVHPTCYNLPTSILPILKTYSWQCLDCKKCQVCDDPHEENKMVFCDDCDRGYHSFCVGLENVPSGSWLCPICGKCGSCEANTAGPTPGDKWKHEYLKGVFINTLCIECSGYFRHGYYCPVCYNVYHNDESDSPMVCCDKCDQWIHTGCDGISDKQYKQMSKDKSSYVCKLCRD